MNAAVDPLVSQLLRVDATPCLSLYVATHRTQPERRDDPTRYRVLVRKLTESLEQAYAPPVVAELMAPFHELQKDEEFWNERKEGIAVFRAPDVFVVQHLDRPVPDLAIVAKTFHLKPILRILETADRYHVLTITSTHVQLYEGDRDGLQRVDLGPDVPLTIDEVLGTQRTERHFSTSNSGGTLRAIAHSTTQDDIDLDTERFFHAIDRSIMEHASLPSGLPLILVGLPDQLGLFFKIRHNPNILLEGVGVHPDGLAQKELVRRAWSIMEPYVHARSIRLADTFRQEFTKGRALDHIMEIAEATAHGRVGTLMVEANRQVPGSVHAETGAIVFDDLDQPDINDVLDELAVMVMRKGGEVLVLPTEHMPSATGAAAILRY